MSFQVNPVSFASKHLTREVVVTEGDTGVVGKKKEKPSQEHRTRQERLAAQEGTKLVLGTVNVATLPAGQRRAMHQLVQQLDQNA